MNASINPGTLKQLRAGKRWSQEKLSREVRHKSGQTISRRQIQRIEGQATSAESVVIRSSTLNALAKALGVRPPDLQKPSEARESSESERLVELKERVSTQTLVKLEVVADAYRVDIKDIIDLAPLFFTFHAESSLRQRRKRLAEEMALRKKFENAIPEFVKFLEGRFEASPVDFQGEHESIEMNDIFGVWLDLDNPFVPYLQELSQEFNDPGLLDVDQNDPGISSEFSKIPAFTVCNRHLDQITDGHGELKQAVLTRKVSIHDLSPDLLSGPNRKELISRALERLRKAEPDRGDDEENDAV